MLSVDITVAVERVGVDRRALNEQIAADLLRRGNRVQRIAERTTPRKTGRTASSYRTFRSGETEVTVRNHTPYFVFTELPTRPHEIRVVEASVLTNGSEFFGRKVQHPGTKGSFALTRALTQGAQ